MSIIKTRKSRNFVSICNDIITNSNLNDEGYRLLTYLLSKPENWQVFNKELLATLKKTEHWLDKAFKNLKENGYLKRTQTHSNGRWVWITEVSDLPEFLDSVEIQPIEIQSVEIQPIVSRPIYKERINKERINKKRREREAPSDFLTSSEVETVETLTQKIKSNEFYSEVIKIGYDKGYTEEECWNLIKPKIIIFLSEKPKVKIFSRFALWLGDLPNKSKDTNYSQKPSRIENKGVEKPVKMVNPLDFATEERFETYCSQESKYFDVVVTSQKDLDYAKEEWIKNKTSQNQKPNPFLEMKKLLLAKKSFNHA